MKTRIIRVDSEDLDKARTQGINRLFEDNPDLEGQDISNRFLFKRMVKFFIEAE